MWGYTVPQAGSAGEALLGHTRNTEASGINSGQRKSQGTALGLESLQKTWK